MHRNGRVLEVRYGEFHKTLSDMLNDIRITLSRTLIKSSETWLNMYRVCTAANGRDVTNLTGLPTLLSNRYQGLFPWG